MGVIFGLRLKYGQSSDVPIKQIKEFYKNGQGELTVDELTCEIEGTCHCNVFQCQFSNVIVRWAKICDCTDLFNCVTFLD